MKLTNKEIIKGLIDYLRLENPLEKKIQIIKEILRLHQSTGEKNKDIRINSKINDESE